MTPEAGINYSQKILGKLDYQINNLKEISRYQSLTTKNILANNAYQNGSEDFSKRQFLATIRNLNYFLNASQQPAIDKYLEAQYMLGFSYLTLTKQERARTALSRYIAAFITNSQNNHGRLIEVIRLILPLYTQSPSLKPKLGQMLSSLLSLHLPNDSLSEIHFYIAQATSDMWPPSLVSEWLEAARSENNSNYLVARSLYHSAQLSIKSKNYAMAEQFLTSCHQIEDLNVSGLRDLATLDLARLKMLQNKPETAYSYYNTINASSPYSQKARLERVYVLMAMDRHQDALVEIEKYRTDYNKTSVPVNISQVLIYLYLKLGHYQPAKIAVQRSDEFLDEIEEFLIKNYQHREEYSHQDLLKIRNKISGLVFEPSLVTKGIQLFERIDEQTSRLHDLRSHINNLIFILGKTPLQEQHPNWFYAFTQFNHLTQSSLQIASILMDAERSLYNNRMSKIDIQELDFHKKQRHKLNAKETLFYRRNPQWKSFAQLGKRLESVRKHHYQVKVSQSILSSLKNLKILDVSQKRDLTFYSQETKSLEQSLTRSAELIRSRQTQNILEHSPDVGIRNHLLSFTRAITHEQAILQRYRNAYSDPSSRQASIEARMNWELWQKLVSSLYEKIMSSRSDMSTILRQRLSRLDDLTTKYNGLFSKIQNHRKSLELYLGKRPRQIFGSYLDAINNQRHKNKLWLADIDWLIFEKTSKQTGNNIEKAILKKNLIKLRKDISWQWSGSRF